MKVEEDLNGSVFSWLLVNIFSSLLSPGLSFISLLFFLAKNPLVVHSIFFLQLIIGNNILCFGGPGEIFLFAKLTFE